MLCFLVLQGYKYKMNSQKFYENLSSDYDDMTRFQIRLESEKQILKNLIEQYKIKSVIDIACGTGLHAIILAQLGLKVVGVDNSCNMLEKAK